MTACTVVAGNVLAFDGLKSGQTVIGVTYASPETIEVGGENALGQWSISASTEKMGRPLEVGTYEGAERVGAEDQGRPGFDLTAAGVSSSCGSSRFRIGAVSLVGSELKSFSVDFEYQCAGMPRVRGCFHYDPTQN